MASGISQANARRKNSKARIARRQRSYQRSEERKAWNKEHGHGHRKAETHGNRLRAFDAKGLVVIDKKTKEPRKVPKLDKTKRPKL